MINLSARIARIIGLLELARSLHYEPYFRERPDVMNAVMIRLIDMAYGHLRDLLTVLEADFDPADDC